MIEAALVCIMLSMPDRWTIQVDMRSTQFQSREIMFLKNPRLEEIAPDDPRLLGYFVDLGEKWDGTNATFRTPDGREVQFGLAEKKTIDCQDYQPSS